MKTKIVQQVVVNNKLGLHIRPAAAIVKLLQKRKSVVSFTNKKETVNARSVMGILMLVAKEHDVVTITVEGEDASATMKELIEEFKRSFGEKADG